MRTVVIDGNTVTLGNIHRYTVTDMRWVSDAQFVAFFALSQALPGPNGMFLAGAGLGLLSASLGMNWFGP